MREERDARYALLCHARRLMPLAADADVFVLFFATPLVQPLMLACRYASCARAIQTGERIEIIDEVLIVSGAARATNDQNITSDVI